MFSQRGIPMTASTSDELNKIGAVDELEIASLRNDGNLAESAML